MIKESIFNSLFTKKSIAMKNVTMAVLLIAVAGTGVYFLFFSKNKNHSSENVIQKELVAGKWKIDSLVSQKDSTKDGLAMLLFAMDSNARKQVCDFQSNGHVLVSLPGDSLAKKDTSSIIWTNENELLWKEIYSDSTWETMTVKKLDKENFVLLSKDSVLIYFKKVN